jgi:hypothetical protein
VELKKCAVASDARVVSAAAAAAAATALALASSKKRSRFDDINPIERRRPFNTRQWPVHSWMTVLGCTSGRTPRGPLAVVYNTAGFPRLFVCVLCDEIDARTPRNKWFSDEARTQCNISRIQTPRAASSTAPSPAAARSPSWSERRNVLACAIWRRARRRRVINYSAAPNTRWSTTTLRRRPEVGVYTSVTDCLLVCTGQVSASYLRPAGSRRSQALTRIFRSMKSNCVGISAVSFFSES